MHHFKQRYSLAGLLFLFFGISLSGCTLVDIRNDKTYLLGGSVINQETLLSIEAGKTNTAWLQKNLGYPSKIIEDGTNRQRYVYLFEERQTKSSRVFLIFQLRSTETRLTETIISCEDGIVVAVSQQEKSSGS